MYKYFYSAASANIAWFVLSKPSTFSVDFAGVVTYYTFQPGGRVPQKVGKFLYEVFAATSTHFGTYTFDVSAATTYTWKDATEHVKGLTPDQWLELKAENKRLVKLETATEFQALLHLWAGELKEFLQHVWNANATTHSVTERPARGQRWKDIPPEFRSLRCRTFIDDEIRCVSVEDHQCTDQCLKTSLLLLGPANAGKTSVSQIMANRQCVASGQTVYGHVQDLDQYGSLTLTGCTSKMGAYIFDDCDLVLKGSEPMTLNNQKALAQTDNASSYPARYRSASFTAMTPKYLIGNLQLQKIDSRHEFVYHVSPQHLLHVWGAWLIHLLNDEVAPLRAQSPDLKAVTRRISVAHTEEVWGASKVASAPAMVQVWDQRAARLAAMDSDSDSGEA